jgi:hypothetical protein
MLLLFVVANIIDKVPTKNIIPSIVVIVVFLVVDV